MTTGFEGLAYPQWVPSPAEYCQRANELQDYSIDWSDYLPTGDAVAASSWSCDTGLVLSGESFTGTATTVWISGGSAGYVYRVFNTVITVGGRTSTRKLCMRIDSAPYPSAYSLYVGVHGIGFLSAVVSVI